MPEHRWVPSPSYLLRRSIALGWVDELGDGDGLSALEVGCGAGAFLLDLARRGYRCTALEFSDGARTLATAMLADHSTSQVFGEPPDAGWEASFDLIVAFEVLEHIEDDREALARWISWLKPGGHLLLSVPAHERRWSVRDEWAGHYRRYEREPLRRRFEDAGLEVLDLDCWGAPVTNLLARAWIPLTYVTRWRKGDSERRLSKRQASERSGTSRGPQSFVYPLQRSSLGRAVFSLADRVQRSLTATEVGTGYLVRARKR